VFIGEGSEDDGPQWPHQEADAEGGQRLEQSAERTLAGEIRIPDGGGKIAEHHEVVHFEEVAAGDADDIARLARGMGGRRRVAHRGRSIRWPFGCLTASTPNAG
jgi:hypothetical protein